MLPNKKNFQSLTTKGINIVMKASELNNIKFPECYKNCEAVETLGVTECESVTSHKFNLETGKPLENIRDNYVIRNT